MTQSPPPPYGSPLPITATGGGASGLAIAALVLGICGLCVPLVGIVALVLGIVALNRADDPARGGGGRGVATTGVVLGGVGIITALIIPMLIGILLPSMGLARATAQRMQSNTQLGGIHQSMAMYAQDNRDLFPGLERRDGDVRLVDATPAGRLFILVDADYFTAEYAVSPSEADPYIEQWRGAGPFTEDHYSYALLSIADPGERRKEWSYTLNSRAIVLTDRNIGISGNDREVQSIHTGQPGDWRGGVVHNDNHVAFESWHRFHTQYGQGPEHRDDNLFESTGADDALLIHTGQ